MRVALVAPLYEIVPPAHYGGTERVVGALADRLHDEGHDVTLFAAGGSTTKGRLVECTPGPLRMRMTRDELTFVAPHLHLKMLHDVYQRSDEFDVIHAHTDIWTLPFLDSTTTPTVLTMHGRLDLDVVREILPLYPNVRLVSISDAQRLAVADLDLQWLATCYNGLDLTPYVRRRLDTDRKYLAFVGRITPEKRPDWAIKIAQRAGLPLRIAAKIDPLDQEYWTNEIEPMVAASPHVDFVGEITEAEKPAFFGGAIATLFPIDWPEPFGLVMIESMAAGTPVIALDRGSVPEVVTSGRSGFVCETPEAMVDAVGQVHEISAEDCQADAARFSAAAMARSYLDVYRSVTFGRARRPTLVPLVTPA